VTPTRIYVNADAIRANARDGDDRPTICVRHADGSTSHTNEVAVLGVSRVVYSREGLPDGTHVWVETSADVEVARAD
jgi:hypothetical protein